MTDLNPSPVRLDAVEFNNMVTPYTDRLFTRLKNDGLELAVVSCTRAERNRSWSLSAKKPYAHEVLRGLELEVGPRRFAHLNRGIFRTLSRLRPKMIVLTGFYPSMLFGLAWSRWTGTPIALRVDGGEADMPQTAYHRLFRPMVLKHCRAALACSEKGAAFFRKAGFEDARIFRMPLVPAWDPPPSLPRFQQRSVDLIWVAEINDRIKNAGFFVQVATRLKKRRPDLTIRVIGRGPDQRAMMDGLAAAGINVRHDETVAWDEMAEALSCAKLLLLPSKREPWGLVCNEALQCGTPCLVSPYVGAADDLVLDEVNGRVLPLDIDRWVEAAAELLDDASGWSAMSERARASMAPRRIEASAKIYREMVAYVLRAETSRLQ
ncbi:MAG: glycosyltransferase family 4 protein [Sphingomonas sp.]